MNDSAKTKRPTGRSANAASEPNVVIRASAGTGKTFQLSNRYLRLLNADAPIDQILATTFTRKAAGEILERVLMRIAEAAADENTCRQLAGFLNAPTLDRDRCLQLLQQVTRNLHRLRISTLDSFFAQIASSFSLELGLPSGWRILEELADAELRGEAIDMILHQEATQDTVRLMHLLSKGAAERTVSQLLRTTVEEVYRVFQDTDAEAWHCIPKPTLMSDEELEQTIADLRAVPLPSDKRFQKAVALDIGRAAAGDWEKFVQNGVAVRVLDGATKYYNKDLEQPLVELYKTLLEQAKSVLLTQLAWQTEGTHELLVKFDEVYRAVKHEARGLRFDDVTARLADRQQLGEYSRLAFRLDGHIHHLLLDEFQDTSLPQWRVVRPFAEQATRDEPGRSFFCVGDAKQAIYGWRGGVAEIFDALQGEFENVGLESLHTSFRSAQPVIDTVNDIFRNMSSHADLKDHESAVRNWCDEFETHSTARTELPGYTCLLTAPLKIEDQSQPDATLQFAARRIAEIVRQAPGRSVGVLTRQNSTIGKLIFLLGKLGISASEEGGNPLTDSAAVQLVMSLLRLADHPGDLVARFHVAQSPLAQVVGLIDVADDAVAHEVSQQIRQRLQVDGYGPTVYEWARELAPNCNRRELSRLQKLVELAYSFAANLSLRTTIFLKYVDSERVSDPTSDDVRVMTVHQAKGLQFDIVVLPELTGPLGRLRDAIVTGKNGPMESIDIVCLSRNQHIRKLLPKRLQQIFSDHARQLVNEALCVLYVAVTRPVHALHMIVPPARNSEKTLPTTFDGLLRAALTDGAPADADSVLYEHGDPTWFDSQPSDKPEPAARESSESASLRIQLAPLTGGRQRGRGRATPSGQEGGSRVKLANVLQIGSTAAMDRGTLIHAWCECITWLDDGRPDESELRDVAAKLMMPSLDVDELLQQFDRMLNSPAIRHALSRESYRGLEGLNLDAPVLKRLSTADLRFEVEQESQFTLRMDETLLSGIIDRLVLIYDGDELIAADILDFKTDKVTPDDADAFQERIDHYRGQLQAYRPAVAKLYGLDSGQISTRLLMLEAGVVQEV